MSFIEYTPKGFATMSKDKQLEYARKGGKNSHANGKAHKFTSEEAREAGRKGGATVSQDKEHMSRIGKLGAAARHKAKTTITALILVLLSVVPAQACQYDWECTQSCIVGGGTGVCVKQGPFTYNPEPGICICIRS